MISKCHKTFQYQKVNKSFFFLHKYMRYMCNKLQQQMILLCSKLNIYNSSPFQNVLLQLSFIHAITQPSQAPKRQQI